jgi:hypothetical protein
LRILQAKVAVPEGLDLDERINPVEDQEEESDATVEESDEEREQERKKKNKRRDKVLGCSR